MLSYPLEWPIGWSRARTRAVAKFRSGSSQGATLGRAREFLEAELGRLKATEVVVSSNLRTRANGAYWDEKQREPGDAGVAVYFKVAGASRALACDRWTRTADNLHALGLHIQAIRGQLRWGVGSVDQALGGYKALPAMGARRLWYEVLGLPHTATEAQIRDKRLELLAKCHPDKVGGDADRAAEINEAFNEALGVIKAEREARP